MLSKMYVVISFLLLISISGFANADDVRYIVSFVAGRTSLGLIFVTRTDSAIEAGQPTFTPMGKNLGSTAVLAQMGYWDYGVDYDVLVINGGGVGKSLKVDLFRFDYELKKTKNLGTLSQIPGQYHPLHLFQTDWSDSGCCRTGTLLTAGSGISGANNYVSYLLYGKSKTRIFVNPEGRYSGSAAAAPDGGVVSQMTFNGLNHLGLIGRLAGGKLVGSPYKWLNVNASHGYSQSLSNPTESLDLTSQKSGTRYLAYRNFRQNETMSESQVMILNVDASTGKPKASSRAITKFATSMNVDAEKFQSIAMSSNGKLILYTAWNNECNKQVLFARKLVNGHSAGNPYVVVGCRQLENIPLGVYGINMTESWPGDCQGC
jgi:hypothetical protein